ncbi:histidine kinase [Streptosporangium sp. NPDC051022]|uniref:sensor histidine kinase n=1 Tax=Streptosporangium sp. NPDC051022 TaxID=3155752 RepID=UPI00341DF5D5
MQGTSIGALLTPHQRFTLNSSAILEAYESRLRALASPLVRTSETWEESRLQAQLILAECAESLRPAGRRGHPQFADLPAHATGHLDPLDAALGWSELFDAVCDHLPAIVHGHPDEAELQKAFLTTLNRGILALSHVLSAKQDIMALDRIHETQLDDRHRLAREIHDWVGSSVSMALLHLDLLENNQRPTGGTEVEIRNIRRALFEISEGARRLVSGLRWRVPEPPLEVALKEFAHTAAPPDTTVDIAVHGDERLLPEHYKSEIFAVIREGMRNAFAHSKAKNVVTRVDIVSGDLLATVDDDGTGLILAGKENSAGLSSMRERIELLHGVFHLASRLSAGTRLRIWVPLPGALSCRNQTIVSGSSSPTITPCSETPSARC